MKRLSSIALSSILATSVILSGTLQIDRVNAKAVEAQGVKLPLMLSDVTENANSVQQRIMQNGNGRQFIEVADIGNTFETAYIRDITTGQVLRTLFQDIDTNCVITNKNEELFIAAFGGNLYSATKYQEQQKLPLNDSGLNFEELNGFIGNTNKFVGKSYSEIYVYDYDANELLFKMPLPNYNAQVIVGKDIVVGYENAITIYDGNGEYVDMIQLNSELKDMEFSPDGQTLVIATEGELLQFYDTYNYQPKNSVGYKNTDNSIDLTFDPTGKYLAMTSLGDAKTEEEGFRIFNTETGARIYTDLDNKPAYKNKENIVLSNNAQFIFYGKNTYNGKNLNVYATGLANKTYTLNVDESMKPEALVQYSNGTTQTVTDGVTWKSGDLTKGFFDEETQTFKAREAGTFNAQVSYLGFTKEITINVLDNTTVQMPGDTGSYEDNDDYINYEEDTDMELEVPDYMDGNYYNEGLGLAKVYLDQRTYKGALPRYTTHVGAFTGATNNGTIRTYLDVARKSSTTLKLKKIILKANGKTLTKKVTSSRSNGYEFASKMFLSSSDLNWIKKNVKSNKKVTIQFVGAKKKVTKTLNTNQKKSLLDNVKLNKDWKALK